MTSAKIEHYVDSKLTVSEAKEALSIGRIRVIWFTNQENHQSVVHSHPYHELILPISGSTVRYSAEGSLYPQPIGSLIYIPAKLYHSGKYNISDTISERLVVQIDDQLWQSALRSSNLKRPLWTDRLALLDTESCSRWNIRELFERMAQTAEVPNPAQTVIFKAQVTELQQLMSLSLNQNTAAPVNSSSKLVSLAVTYLQDNYRDPTLTVTKLAQKTYTSREYLSRTFKQYTMESIHGYLTNLRMQHCRRALASGASVLDACNDSGFSNYSSFLKTFRTLYGITPVEFRAQCKIERGTFL